MFLRGQTENLKEDGIRRNLTHLTLIVLLSNLPDPKEENYTNKKII